MRGGRILYLDVVRLMACCMVVLMHSPMPATQENSLFLLALSYMTAPCIGLFLMVSGALLLPVREDARVFLRRRL
ncbi:MAG: acyltransferase family protein, partial [Duncaniella sp.]|nr:acyltransferase family protein [Duncaniella sp.]